MALGDSGRAIGAATRLLQDHLMRRGFEVAVGRPEAAAKNNNIPKLNLFLYETELDAQLRNTSLRDGEPAPLWLVLKYLLTAFEDSESSDSAAAHELLGRSLAALHALSFLPLDADVSLADRQALEPNPEPLKLTLDPSSSELLSKVMQGSDERYRLSVALQLRPVLVAPAIVPRSALLVGIDYSQPTQVETGVGGLALQVQASISPQLSRVVPDRFEAGAAIDVYGTDLSGTDLEVVLGDVVLTVLERRADCLRVQVPDDLGGTLSAGEWPLIVRRRLSATRTRSSNLLAPRLLPTLRAARFEANELVLEGMLLGSEADDVLVSYYRDSDGVTVAVFDDFTPSAGQQSLRVPQTSAAVPPGDYRVVLRVNNQQARSSPRVTVA